MPSLADLEAAIPRCVKRVVTKHSRQGGVHHSCWAPLSYRAADNMWACGVCGAAEPGGSVAARAADMRMGLAA
jgi:ribosomal protein L37AE/L43A